MKLINHNINTSDKKQLYNMTHNPQAQPMKDMTGREINVQTFAQFEDDNTKDGITMYITSIKDSEGNVYVTNSKSFYREFQTICEIMENELFTIKVTSAKSKNNREYISCILV